MDSQMTPEARKLLLHLLEHQRKMQKEILISYKRLCQKAGVPFNRATIGHYLFEVADWCDKNGLPPINALVVQKASGKPGFNYTNAPGGKRSWTQAVGESLTSKKFPSKIR